jgi:hypothetical protein
MKQLMAWALMLVVVLTGCNRATVPTTGPQTHDLFGGKYFVEVETEGSFIGRMEGRTATCRRCS